MAIRDSSFGIQVSRFKIQDSRFDSLFISNNIIIFQTNFPAKSYKNAATDINDLTEYIQIVDALYFSKQSHQELYQPNVSTKDVSIPWGPVVEGKCINSKFVFKNKLK